MPARPTATSALTGISAVSPLPEMLRPFAQLAPGVPTVFQPDARLAAPHQAFGCKCRDEKLPMLHSGARRFGLRARQSSSFSGRDASAGSGLVSRVVAPWNRANVDDARTTIRGLRGKEGSVERASCERRAQRHATASRRQGERKISHFFNSLQTSKRFFVLAAHLGILRAQSAIIQTRIGVSAKVAPAEFCP